MCSTIFSSTAYSQLRCINFNRKSSSSTVISKHSNYHLFTNIQFTIRIHYVSSFQAPVQPGMARVSLLSKGIEIVLENAIVKY